MAEPPHPPAQRPLLTPACSSRILGMGANNRTSQDSRPNSHILFSTPFPTSEVGYTRPYGSFGVAPQNVIPMPLPPYQAQIQQGTGVFHPAREATENRRANYNNIRERRIKQDNDNKKEECPNNNGSKEKKEKKKWNKKKNGGSEKKKKEEECQVPNLPPGIVLPMEWPYPDSF